MEVQVDKTTYAIDIAKVCDHLTTMYQEHSKVLDKPLELVTAKGKKKTVDLSKKSLLRTALKAALVPFVNPILEAMYASKGLELPKHEKHTDYIDYMIVHLIGYFAKVEKDFRLYAESIETSDGNVRRVSTLSTVAPEDRRNIRQLPERTKATVENS